MNRNITIALLLLLSVTFAYGQIQEDKVPLAPKQNRRPDNYQPLKSKYSLEELKNNFSEDMMRLAAKQYDKVQKTNNNGRWKPTPESIDSHQAPEWFKDAKFGMAIDWGPWSLASWAPKKEKGAMYPDWYEMRMYVNSPILTKYHEKNWGKDFERDDFIPLFTAREYNPEMLVELAVEAGVKYILPFNKHHAGFCLWPSSYTQRDAGDMGPKKDLIKPLVESCKEKGLKFGFYFSLEEWEYPMIGDDDKLEQRMMGGKTKPYATDMEGKCSGKIAVKHFAKDYLVPQATEFIDKYDPDIIWYDGQWRTPAIDLQSYDIAAYFYNQAQGRKDVAVNDRYGLDSDGKDLRVKRGDFFTNEYHDRDNKVQKTTCMGSMPWC